jgi:hypothetical protein
MCSLWVERSVSTYMHASVCGEELCVCLYVYECVCEAQRGGERERDGEGGEPTQTHMWGGDVFPLGAFLSVLRLP